MAAEAEILSGLRRATRRLLRRVASDDFGWWAGGALFVVVLGMAGRHTSNEVHDACALVALLIGAGKMAERHKREPFALYARTERAFEVWKRDLAGGWPRLGVDLRRRPPVRSGVPARLSKLTVAVALATTALVVRPFPADAELLSLARDFAYPLLLLGSAALWATYAVIALAGGFIGGRIVLDLVRGARPTSGHQLRTLSKTAAARWLVGALLFVLLVPSRFALFAAIAFIAVDLALVWLPTRGDLAVLWRRIDGRGPYRTMSLRTLSSIEPILLLGAVVLPLVVPDIREPVATGWTVAPITRALHGAAAFGALATVLAIVAYRMIYVTVPALHPPSRPVSRRVHVEADTGVNQERASAILARDGWAVVRPGGRRGVRLADDLVLRVAERGGPDGAIAIERLEEPACLAGLRRRADLRSRRNVMKGLETIFRHAARVDRSIGTGFVLAPHQWFMAGLERDIAAHDASDEAALGGHIPPEYRAVMTRRARHHLWTILDGVGVDLVHVEYGVPFRTLALVLRIAFEVFDVHEGQRDVADADFAGVHGVRVLVHEVDLEQPRISPRYPESGFEETSRARIVHVFRDRGGDWDAVDVPERSDGLPVVA